MPEFRKVREKHSLLTVCKTPDLATEVTLQPLKRFDLDAAIIFADILLPLEPMGIKLDFIKGEGPTIFNPISNQHDVEVLRPVDPQSDLGFVMKAISSVRKEINIPLIGFAGAPFTLASYMIEGGHSRNYIKTKKMMYEAPELWALLMEKLTKVLIDYLCAQADAGANTLQIFDSWIGALSYRDYRKFIFPHMKVLFDGLKKTNVPVIHFGTGTASLLKIQREAGGDVIGLDWRIPLDDGWKTVGHDIAIQGNLDPVTLFGPISELEKQVDDIVMRAANRPGHIFNLGHGILPETPQEHVEALIEFVHKKTTLSSRTA